LHHLFVSTKIFRVPDKDLEYFFGVLLCFLEKDFLVQGKDLYLIQRIEFQLAERASFLLPFGVIPFVAEMLPPDINKVTLHQLLRIS
jgi:hypothetical protein